MTTSTPRTNSGPITASRSQSGFSLAEALVATTLSGLVLAGVMSTFLFIGRTGFTASTYSEMEAQCRRAMEAFGTDARKATDIRWNNSQSITLYVATSGSATAAVTYAYDNIPESPTFRSFLRISGEVSSSAPRMILARNVEPDLSFQRFKLEQSEGAKNIAANDLETKQVQLSLRLTRTGKTTVAATHPAYSALFLLRNKRVSN